MAHEIPTLAAGKPCWLQPGPADQRHTRLRANSTIPTWKASAFPTEPTPHSSCVAKASPESTMRDVSECFPSTLLEWNKSSRWHSRNRGLAACSHLSSTENKKGNKVWLFEDLVASSLLLHKILCHTGCTGMLWALRKSSIHLLMRQKVSGKPRWNTTRHSNTAGRTLLICFRNGKYWEANVNRNKLQEMFCNLKLTT